jgi:hypothetical protein
MRKDPFTPGCDDAAVVGVATVGGGVVEPPDGGEPGIGMSIGMSAGMSVDGGVGGDESDTDDPSTDAHAPTLNAAARSNTTLRMHQHRRSRRIA